MEMSSVVTQNEPARRSAAVLGAGALGIVGGLLVAAGSLLPWFTLFAGLHPYPGTTGLYGRMLVAGGVLVALAGAGLLWTGHRLLRRALGGAGVALLAFAAWLAVGMYETYQTLQAEPMWVARLGPGLFVVVAGAVLVASTVLFRDRGGVGGQGRTASA